jgi:ATP-binding cassette subfamily B protein
MSESFVSIGRIAEVIAQEREPVDEGSVQVVQPNGKALEVAGHIRFADVTFTYPTGGKAVLNGITLEAQPGQSIALLGATGSGKTSLVNLLPRFYEYTGGSLTLDGVDLKEYPRAFLRSQVGIVEQEPFLFSMSVRDNISYGVGRLVSDQEVEEAARAASIHDVILAKLPEGYRTMVGERGITLSGGQKQRVAIARTLLKDPRILILDDSTSSVDSETEGEIREALERLMQGRTTFIIAHRIQSVMNADQILVLDQGRVVQRGTHDALVAEPGPYRRIYEAQTQIEAELELELVEPQVHMQKQRNGGANHGNGHA